LQQKERRRRKEKDRSGQENETMSFFFSRTKSSQIEHRSNEICLLSEREQETQVGLKWHDEN